MSHHHWHGGGCLKTGPQYTCTLHTAGFGAVAGIASITACLPVNQLPRRGSLVHEPADDEPGSRRDNEIARKNHQKQTAPSELV
jgi:hypothetical protein